MKIEKFQSLQINDIINLHNRVNYNIVSEFSCNLIGHIVCGDMWLSCFNNVTTGFRAQVSLEIFTKIMKLQTEQAKYEWKSFCFKIAYAFYSIASVFVSLRNSYDLDVLVKTILG